MNHKRWAATRHPAFFFSSLVGDGMRAFIARLARESDGQDLIEYALLSSFIGLCCVLVWPSIRLAIGAAFIGWDSNVQALSSCTPDPGGGGC